MPHHAVVPVVLSLIAWAAPSERPASFSDFEKSIDAYMDVRKKAVKDLPVLPKEAEPEQIQARQKATAERIRAARAGAEPGDVILTAVRPLLRERLDAVLAQNPASKQKEITTGNPGREGQSIPLRVNASYPEDAPRSSVPTAVLAVLPKLPKELEYRFHGDHLLLLDTEANLIVDFMTKAADPPARREGHP